MVAWMWADLAASPSVHTPLNAAECRRLSSYLTKAVKTQQGNLIACLQSGAEGSTVKHQTYIYARDKWEVPAVDLPMQAWC